MPAPAPVCPGISHPLPRGEVHRRTLHVRIEQVALSPRLRATMEMDGVDRAPPAFSCLPEACKDVLIRGFAADYVQPQVVADEGYLAAGNACGKTGAPIAWAQMFVAAGHPLSTLASACETALRVFAQEWATTKNPASARASALASVIPIPPIQQ